MKFWCACLAVLAIAVTSSAAPSADAPELEKLRASYKAAVAKGTKPVWQAHIITLEKLRDIYARGSNLTGAAKVQAHIERANQAMATGETVPPGGDANDATAPELDKLRASQDAAIERAIKPLRETYMRELDKVRDNYTRAANLAAAMAVQTEIDTLKPGGAQGKAADLPTPGKPLRLYDVGEEKLFVNKTWITTGGSVYHFNKGGTGVVTIKDFKTPFTWKKLRSGIIEVTRPVAEGAPATQGYFKFDNAVTAMKSDTLGGAQYPVHIEN